MSCARYTFIINQGETFYRRIVYKDSNGLPVDLTDYSGRLQLRPAAGSSTIYLTLSSSIGSDGSGLNFTPASQSISGTTVTTYTLPTTSGSIGITISAYSSSLLTFTEAVGDLFIYSGSGDTEYRDRVMEIKAKVSKSATSRT